MVEENKEQKESKNQKVDETKEKKNRFTKRTILVLFVLAFFTISTIVSVRAEQLKIIGINSTYESIFLQKMKNKYTIFGIIFVSIYIFIYILNKFIKRGLNKFFLDEKKEIPKLPNKSICVLFALIGAIVGSRMLADKFSIFANAAMFGRTDPIFGADIGYYMFSIPFIQTILIFLIEVIGVAIIYVALYYVITLNVYFDGIDVETLKKNTFIKQELFLVALIAIVFCAYIFIGAQNILTENMIKIADENETELIGAGKTDVTVKLWGYRILSFVIFIAVLRLIINVRKQNFKQGFLSILIVPAYLLCLFIALTYFQIFHVKTNELDNEKEYIGYNIKNTKEAYGIDIDQQKRENYKTITSTQVSNNQEVISNIPLISKNITMQAVAEHQENGNYYDYKKTFLSLYKVNNKNQLLYITPREISNEAISRSYNNKTFHYTHGFSAVVSSATDSDNDGYAEYVLSDFTNNQDNFNIKEPRIYFGLQTNSTIMVNTDFGEEYDYPLTASTYQKNVYTGKAGIKLGFFDRLVLAIDEKNLGLAFSSEINKDTKIISNRNIIERAKKILPDILYDENPYLVVTDEGRLVWVLDGYTRSDAYPYSQSTIIDIKGYKEKINYIRNSVKVLIDAYDGTTKFYITDQSDPIIMTYRNMYANLFIEDELPVDIQNHLVYPEFLYKIQADMINIYHDISEDTLYRADDIWQITTKASTTNSNVAGVGMEPYYTMFKTSEKDKPELGLILTYNKYGKQYISSYLVGTVDNGKSKLSLYKFNSENNIVGIMQLNKQIEQDATISKELENLNTTGTKLLKEMIIVPIENTLLYVEPVYQVMLNADSEIPVLKKVIVASGNTVAIGDTLDAALTNLFNDDYAVDLEIINVEDIEDLIDSIIKANNNLEQSLNANNFELIGKDISKLQAIIKVLENTRKLQLEKEQEEMKEKKNDVGEIENPALEETNVVVTDENILNTILENVVPNN